MSTVITDTYAADHHRCDRLLAAAERRIDGKDWPAAIAATHDLTAALEQHFALEEERLFPALAAVFKVAENPIEIMVSEHAQMRALLADLNTAVGSRDRAACLGLTETLNLLIQQHNYKEEGVLYPMADGALSEQAEALAAQVAAMTVDTTATPGPNPGSRPDGNTA